MPVYVDSFRGSYKRMVMCHMVADTRAELHAMAARLGLKRSWFQDTPKASSPHYDIALSKRALAVKLGAIEVDRLGLVEVVRRGRAAGWP